MYFVDVFSTFGGLLFLTTPLVYPKLLTSDYLFCIGDCVMELHIEGNRYLVAQGRVDFKNWKSQNDGFVIRIQAMAAAFVQLRKNYSKFLSDDGKIIGQERVSLLENCDAVFDAALGALYHGLCAQYTVETDPDKELVVPGCEQAFWVRRSGAVWHLREKLPASGSLSLGDRLESLATGELAELLAQLREHAADGLISVSEQASLLPKLLGLLLALLELRYSIEACRSSF